MAASSHINAMQDIRHVALRDGGPVRYRAVGGPRRRGIVALRHPDTPLPEAPAVATGDYCDPPLASYPLPISVSFGGGPVAAGSGVQLIFWGNAWNQPATISSSAKIAANVRSVLSGPWRAGLRQYGIGRIPYMGALVVTQPRPPATFTEVDVDAIFLNLIDGGVIPGGRVTLYFVFMPPGTTYAPGGIRGEHWALVYEDPTVPLGPSTAWIGLILNSSESEMMSTFSHELAEMLTDPDPGAGWMANSTPPQPGTKEIGDPCNAIDHTLSGVTVQSYWSLKDNCCLVPRAPSVRTTLSLAGVILAGKGLRSVRDPIASLVGLTDELFGSTL